MKVNPFFGEFGGQFVPEVLVQTLDDLEAAYLEAIDDSHFNKELNHILNHFAGRPTPLFFCPNLSEKYQNKIYLKREDLLHSGAHKINQVIAQALLCKRMGKRHIIAETGAGQHGVATAMVCAHLGLKARIYMGAKDCERQRPNVFRMKMLGAKVIPVESGERTLKDACLEALRDWTLNYKKAHYLLGTAAGPHPFPQMVAHFQKIIGIEVKKQILEEEGRLPDALYACVGGGSNAIGLFKDFIDDNSVELWGAEPEGLGLNSKRHGLAIQTGSPGIFFGMKSLLMQEGNGQIKDSYSISAGLDFPSVGPEHAHLHKTGRAHYEGVKDEEAMQALKELSLTEGIIPAIETAHALALCFRHTKIKNNQILVVNLSGRGDKDLETLMQYFGGLD